MSDIVTLAFPGDEPERRPEVVMVPFLDGAIPCALVEGEPMVILKPVSDLLGLSWAPQHAKLSADQAACITFIVTQVGSDSQARRHMAVSLETFAVWLARLQPSRVKAEARETVLVYQREAGRALRTHFFGQRAEMVRSADADLDVIQSMLDGLRQQRAELRAQQARTSVLEAKVEAIEGRHDWFTALAYAKLTDRATDRPYLAKVGRRAAQILRARGEQPVPRQDATFGSINTYPSDVLAEAFEAVKR